MSTTKKPVIAVIYIRVASHNRGKEKFADDQEKQLRAFASSHGYTVNDKNVYREIGLSGLLPVKERPKLKKILEEAKAGNFKALIVRDISRLFRTPTLLLNFIEDLKSLGVKVVTTTGESFDTSIPEDKFVITIMASMAETESRHRSELAKRVINKKNGTTN